MLRRFIRDSAVYGLVKVLTSSVFLILLPLYTRTLAPLDYGVVDYLNVASNLIYLTVALEIAQGFARYFASARSPETRKLYSSTALWFTVATFSVFAVASALLAKPIATTLLGSPRTTDAVRAAAFAVWGQGIFNFLQNQLRYEVRPRLFAIASLVFAGVSIAMSCLFLLVLSLGIVGVFLAQACAALAGATTALWFARSMIVLKFDWGKCKEMLAFSTPLVLSGLGVFAVMYADRIGVRHLISLGALGIYAVGYRIASIVLLSMAGSQMAITPLIYQHCDLPETPFQIARILQWVLALALPLILLIGMFAPEIVSLLAAPNYAEASRVVFPLAVAFLFSNLYMFAPGAWIANKTGAVAAINVGTAIGGIGLNWVLIPLFGLMGAACANGTAAVAAFVAYVIVGQRWYPIPYSWTRICAALLMAVGFGAAVVWLQGFPVSTQSLTSVVLRGIGWCLSSVLIGLVLLGRTEIIRGIRLISQWLGPNFHNRLAKLSLDAGRRP